MSFILDALKKSESDRQRQSGPALFEVKVTPPKPRFPYWALALAALLVINIAVGAWVYLHRPPAEPAATSAAAAPAGPAASSAAAPAAAAPTRAVPPATTTGAPTAPPHPATRSAAIPPEPVLSADAEAKDAPRNPDDYAPAVAPEKQNPDQGGSHVRSGTESGLKSYADAASSPEAHLPALRVDLHVYAAKPEERFVLINMHRLHEGETLPDGVRVESITPEGVVVSYQGAKFILEHE
jgi:general secretion pathway protein B